MPCLKDWVLNDIGLDRGQLGDGVVVKFQRAGNKLLLVQPNQRYRAITENEKKEILLKKLSLNRCFTDLKFRRSSKVSC